MLRSLEIDERNTCLRTDPAQPTFPFLGEVKNVLMLHQSWLKKPEVPENLCNRTFVCRRATAEKPAKVSRPEAGGRGGVLVVRPGADVKGSASDP